MTTKELHEVEPCVAVESLRGAPAEVGIVLPSLGVEPGGRPAGRSA
ncbi:hypothetical protein ACFVJI_05075 [Streptomyces sp. NPDC127584]